MGQNFGALEGKYISKMAVSEIKYLRRMMGRTARIRVRIRSIREELDQRLVVEEVESKQLHRSMRINKYPRKYLEMRLDGQRKRLKWEDSIKEFAMIGERCILEGICKGEK